MTRFKEILAGTAILVVALTLGTVSCRQSIKAWMIHRDVRSYAKIIRGSGLPVADKVSLLDKLDVLDNYLRTTPSAVSLVRWWEFDGVVTELLTPINPEKLTLLEREISKLETEIAKQKNHYDSVPRRGTAP